MTTFLYTHPVCIEHDPGNSHPECPDRLRSVMAGLSMGEFDDLRQIEAPLIEIDEIKQKLLGGLSRLLKPSAKFRV